MCRSSFIQSKPEFIPYIVIKKNQNYIWECIEENVGKDFQVETVGKHLIKGAQILIEYNPKPKENILTKQITIDSNNYQDSTDLFHTYYSV